MADKHILQYFVFNENGTDILEANALAFDTDKELMSAKSTMVRNYRRRPRNEKWQLMLVNNTTGKVLYNSKEDKKNA